MIYFEKYHGTGNDFIIINGIDHEIKDHSGLAKSVCHRRFGIGADGLIVVYQSNEADIKMVYYNSDGTEAPMCGNGIRCFSRYVYDHQIVKKNQFNVETQAGLMEIKVNPDEDYLSVTVNLGEPSFDLSEMDVLTDDDKWIDKSLEMEGTKMNHNIVTLGTLHDVIFVDCLDTFDFDAYGPLIEKHHLFPKYINVNFTEVIDENTIRVKTHERGAGPTLSCGTGSSSAAYMYHILNKINRRITVHVPGGTLHVEVKDNQVYLEGPAVKICHGSLDELRRF